MIDKSWLEEQIELLDKLEAPAALRVADAERSCRHANGELLEAKGELETLRSCKTELMWQLANIKAKEGLG